ncbi:MAG: hypothetical protein SOW18_01625 [Peptoniphilus sp.]|nr:hypothetical protein [Peptoniphilus sp.]MDY3118218.1 hypothetical protein [Peptoniphilus sp.]
MKNNRDLLLTSLLTALWAGLYAVGWAGEENLRASALLALAYFLTEWVQQAKTPARCFALCLGNGLVAYSLPVLKTLHATDTISGLLVLAYSLSYFLQFNAFRKSVYALFTTRKKKWAACLLSSLAFGLIYFFAGPNFPSPGPDLLASLPAKIYQDPTPAAVAWGVYGALFLFLPNVGIVKSKH